MDTAPAMIMAVLVVSALIVIAAFIWNSMGWKTFTFKSGDSVSWSAAASANGVSDTSQLRFKNVIFTISVGPPGNIHQYTKDVTAVLNGMAVAYKGTGGTTVNPGVLSLDRQLNAFSFLVMGLNDANTVALPRDWTQYEIACPSDGNYPAGQTCGPDGKLVFSGTNIPVLNITVKNKLQSTDANPLDPNKDYWSSATATLTGSFKTL